MTPGARSRRPGSKWRQASRILNRERSPAKPSSDAKSNPPIDARRTLVNLAAREQDPFAAVRGENARDAASAPQARRAANPGAAPATGPPVGPPRAGLGVRGRVIGGLLAGFQAFFGGRRALIGVNWRYLGLFWRFFGGLFAEEFARKCQGMLLILLVIITSIPNYGSRGPRQAENSAGR